MSGVTEETVEHVARLACLSLTDEERVVYARQLDEILRYAEAIQALDTTKIEPMSHAGTASVLRDEKTHEGLARDVALAVAPDAADGFFRVPRVIQ